VRRAMCGSLRRRRRMNLPNQFGELDDYLEDPSVHFLTNGAEAALNPPQ